MVQVIQAFSFFIFFLWCAYFNVVNGLDDDQNLEEKKRKKSANWWARVCSKISLESNFPNQEIIKMYLCNDHGSLLGMLSSFNLSV